MLKVIFTLIFSLICFSHNINAQYEDMAKPVYKNNRMTAINNIDTGLTTDEISNCGTMQYTGIISSIKEGYPIVMVTLKTPKYKEYISIRTENMSMADRSNFFYSLLKKGNRLTINAYICGSGGFLYAYSVKSASFVVKRKGNVRTQNNR